MANKTKGHGTPIDETLVRQLRSLEAMDDSEIDTLDPPELSASRWRSEAVRGKFYRPIKRAVSLRIDSDVLEWFKKKNEKYQTKINEVLRAEMLREDDGALLRSKPEIHVTDVSAAAMEESQLIANACFAEFRDEPSILLAANIFSFELNSGSVFPSLEV